MKKLVLALSLGLLTSAVYAACVGPFCWDDRGAYVNGTIMDGNGAGMPNMTVAQAQAATPRALGQEVWCTNCTSFNGGLGMPCISTGTTNPYSYIAESTGTAVSQCK